MVCGHYVAEDREELRRRDDLVVTASLRYMSSTRGKKEEHATQRQSLAPPDR